MNVSHQEMPMKTDEMTELNHARSHSQTLLQKLMTNPDVHHSSLKKCFTKISGSDEKFEPRLGIALHPRINFKSMNSNNM